MKVTIGCLTVLLGLALLVVFMPNLDTPRTQSRRMQAMMDLKRIGLALSYYEAEHGALPPAVVSDAEGNPLYSWRVLLLPYLEQHNLYEEFDLDQAWDSPANLSLSSKIPTCYICWHLDYSRGETAFVALVSTDERRTAILRETSQALADIAADDGLAATAIVVEDRSHPVIWSQPQDVSPEQFLDNLPTDETITPWVALVTCDTSTSEIENPTRTKLLPLLYANDGKVPK